MIVSRLQTQQTELIVSLSLLEYDISIWSRLILTIILIILYTAKLCQRWLHSFKKILRVTWQLNNRLSVNAPALSARTLNKWHSVTRETCWVIVSALTELDTVQCTIQSMKGLCWSCQAAEHNSPTRSLKLLKECLLMPSNLPIRAMANSTMIPIWACCLSRSWKNMSFNNSLMNAPCLLLQKFVRLVFLVVKHFG